MERKSEVTKMNNNKLNEKQVAQLWELCQEMKIVGVPTTGDYEDIRSNVFMRCLTEANQSFLLKSDNFERAAKRILKCSLFNELERLSSGQAAFENEMVPFSALDELDEAGEVVAAYEPADPKSTTREYYPCQETDWQNDLIAIYDEVRAKVDKLPRDLRKLALALMRGITMIRAAERMGVSRATIYNMRNKLKVVFASTWEKIRKFIRG